MNSMSTDLNLILPLLIVLGTAVVTLIFEMLRKPGYSLILMIAGLITAAVFSGLRLDHPDTTAFSDTFRVDLLQQWSVIILSGATLLCSGLIRTELKGHPREGTLYSLLVFSSLGSMILAGSGDIMFLILGLLISSLGGFALAAVTKTDRATEGSMKYFVYGSVTGAMMLFCLTYWAGWTGSTLLSALNDPSIPVPLIALGFIGVLAGLGYATSLFPFHFWTPDTFEGAPVAVAAYLSVVPKIGGFFALTQVMKEITSVHQYNVTLAVISVASMTFGNVVALRQNNLVRVLAYSTIAQAGFFLLAIIGIRSSVLAVDALIIFSIAYAVMNIGAFAILGQCGTRLKELTGLVKANVFYPVALLIFLLSLTGIPPLAGFTGKLLLFGAAMDSGFTWLAVAGILNSALSLAVYLRIIHPVFFGQPLSKKPVLSKGYMWVVWISLILTLGGGIIAGWFVTA